MYRNLYLSVTIIGLTVILGPAALLAQGPSDHKKIPWSLTVVVMDGIDQREKAEIPVREAVAFIEARSRFVFDVEYVKTSVPHKYTSFKADPKKRARPDNMVHYMLAADLPRSVVRSLPVSSSYLFLYKLFGRRPAQAGSSLGVEYGLFKGGKLRPWATVPTDLWFYTNTPQHGFDSWAAQILTHEIINTIQAKIEARPYRCATLTGSAGVRADKYEAERLTKLTDGCYRKLGNNAN